jgi:hypothetical protein
MFLFSFTIPVEIILFKGHRTGWHAYMLTVNENRISNILNMRLKEKYPGGRQRSHTEGRKNVERN